MRVPLWKEFKAFALKGNILDLAIAVIIGAAFGKIVSSLVADILTPLIGMLFGGVDVSGLKATFGDTTLAYGLFLQSVIDFFIVSFSIFLFIRLLTGLKRKRHHEEELPKRQDPVLTGEEKLLIEIRDLLKDRQGKL
ncbi:Large-conductance mechanosensitive channel [Paenibacillus sp. P22]|nr:Large-conductance mechanosensitive channel [Paenibacillus sp. P22]